MERSDEKREKLVDNKVKIQQFSKHLFWDVNRTSLDFNEHKSYIIKQVLEYGLINDWGLIQKYYGIKQIGRIAQTFRELDKKALSFISFLSKTPLEEFRCYTYQQSIPQHWNF
ncbi:DUF6922 domain-containing protein [Bacteroidota bacterium]